MQNRITVVSALAVIVPVLVVLIALVILARPSSAVPTASSGDAMSAPRTLAPTSASATQSASMSANQTAAAPTANASMSANQPAATPTPVPAPRPSGPLAPDFDGGGAWINSAPLTLADLNSKGKVVLVDFWTFGCYNCANTLPYLKQWWAKYKDQGLVIVGVHTPEFSSEHVLENVQEAVKRQEIGWPVVQDNDYTIWRAYSNNYWPHFYLVDERGQIIYDHIGEGAYAETDAQIAAALAARNK